MVQLTLEEIGTAIRDYLRKKGVPVTDDTHIQWDLDGAMKIAGQKVTLTARVDFVADDFGGPYR
jgi:hypothetical protein